MHLVASVCPSVRLRALSRLKVFVCVSVISGHMLIIARMGSIGILIIIIHFVFKSHLFCFINGVSILIVVVLPEQAQKWVKV